MMVNLVSEVLSHSLGEVVSSPLVLKLLSAYSKLYLNGKQPGTCGRCFEKYYNQLKMNGIMKAKEYEETKNRTCVPAWNGNMYIHKLCRHFNNENITDKQALMLLNEKHVKESAFKTLPDGYKEEPKPDSEPKPKPKPTKKNKQK